MKTIKEWLEELPEPYRSEAIENMESDDYSSYSGNDLAEDMKQALHDSFIWLSTPQGHSYWSKLYHSL